MFEHADAVVFQTKLKKCIHDYQMPGPFLSQLPEWLAMRYAFPWGLCERMRLPLDTGVWRHVQDNGLKPA